eukprot:2719775-Pyramimonas_sp.AAC.3
MAGVTKARFSTLKAPCSPHATAIICELKSDRCRCSMSYFLLAALTSQAVQRLKLSHAKEPSRKQMQGFTDALLYPSSIMSPPRRSLGICPDVKACVTPVDALVRT